MVKHFLSHCGEFNSPKETGTNRPFPSYGERRKKEEQDSHVLSHSLSLSLSFAFYPSSHLFNQWLVCPSSIYCQISTANKTLSIFHVYNVLCWRKALPFPPPQSYEDSGGACLHIFAGNKGKEPAWEKRKIGSLLCGVYKRQWTGLRRSGLRAMNWFRNWQWWNNLEQLAMTPKMWYSGGGGA